MGRNSRKRKHAQFAEDVRLDHGQSINTGIAFTLDNLRTQKLPQQDQKSTDQDASQPKSGDWITVGKNGKRQKQTTYPSLTYASLHKLQSSLKVADLQNLVLYCLADGVSTSWVSVQQHASIKKAVVIMVPGLEKGMFDGSIPVEESSSNAENGKDDAQPGGAVSSKTGQDSASTVASTIANHKAAKHGNASLSPDNFMPIRLDCTSLPGPLRTLADVFVYLWPVKAPGDDKFSRIHSPLHAMLTAPITKSQEEKRQEKQIKGAKPAKEGQHWENQRTPITAFISSKQELIENEYVVHPAMFRGEEEIEQEILRREAAEETRGWVGTLVGKIEDAEITDEDIQQGSLTAGRTVLAMDCEMCKVESGEMALTRISVVGWDGEVVLDELVKPDQRIIDYLTPYAFPQVLDWKTAL